MTREHPLSVVIAGGQRAGTPVAELWSGSALVALVYEQRDGLVVSLSSHARGPIALSATALEHALATAREQLTSCARRPAGPTSDSRGPDGAHAAEGASHVLA